MSLRELWAKTPENRRGLRPKSRKTQPGTASSGPDKMAEGEEIDGLVTKISEGVFTKLSSSLDTKLDQIAVERRVEDAEQRISDTENTVSQLLAKLEQRTRRTGPDAITSKSSTCQNAHRVPTLKTSSRRGC